jgi:hypothetical protein
MLRKRNKEMINDETRWGMVMQQNMFPNNKLESGILIVIR